MNTGKIIQFNYSESEAIYLQHQFVPMKFCPLLFQYYNLDQHMHGYDVEKEEKK